MKTLDVSHAIHFLLETGLLFEINRSILHPVGLALVAEVHADGRYALGGLFDCRDDPEGIIYTDGDLRSGEEKVATFYLEQGTGAMASRKAALGYIKQSTLVKT